MLAAPTPDLSSGGVACPRPTGCDGLRQLPSAPQSQLCPQSLQAGLLQLLWGTGVPFPGAPEVTCGLSMEIHMLICVRTMLICSGFWFHAENPGASSPRGTSWDSALPPPHLPEGRLAQNWPCQILPALNPVRQAGDAQVYWAQSKAVCRGTEVSAQQ